MISRNLQDISGLVVVVEVEVVVEVVVVVVVVVFVVVGFSAAQQYSASLHCCPNMWIQSPKKEF